MGILALTVYGFINITAYSYIFTLLPFLILDANLRLMNGSLLGKGRQDYLALLPISRKPLFAMVMGSLMLSLSLAFGLQISDDHLGIFYQEMHFGQTVIIHPIQQIETAVLCYLLCLGMGLYYWFSTYQKTYQKSVYMFSAGALCVANFFASIVDDEAASILWTTSKILCTSAAILLLGALIYEKAVQRNTQIKEQVESEESKAIKITPEEIILDIGEEVAQYELTKEESTTLIKGWELLLISIGRYYKTNKNELKGE